MSPVTPSSPEDPHFEILLEFMKENRGFDFTGYKRASLARRVRRRMSAIGVESYEEYLDRLLVDVTLKLIRRVQAFADRDWYC